MRQYIHLFIVSLPLGCNINEFECKSDKFCISGDKVQDGIDDCPDGSDEQCRQDQLRCERGLPKCVDQKLAYDGVNDCADGSDEDVAHVPLKDVKYKKKASSGE